MSGPEESARVYVGNLPDTCSSKDVEAEFEKFGKLTSCELKKNVGGTAFAFLEYEDPRDAHDAIKEKDGTEFLGKRLRVEIPFGAKEDGRGSRRRGPGPPRRGRYLVEVTGLPPSGSWQDLKDHMREAGECAHADVFRGGVGEVSFYTRSDMEYAIDKFDGSTFKSHEGEKNKDSCSRVEIKPQKSQQERVIPPTQTFTRKGTREEQAKPAQQGTKQRSQSRARAQTSFEVRLVRTPPMSRT